jgi:hypothetical protein
MPLSFQPMPPSLLPNMNMKDRMPEKLDHAQPQDPQERRLEIMRRMFGYTNLMQSCIADLQRDALESNSPTPTAANPSPAVISPVHAANYAPAVISPAPAVISPAPTVISPVPEMPEPALAADSPAPPAPESEPAASNPAAALARSQKQRLQNYNFANHALLYFPDELQVSHDGVLLDAPNCMVDTGATCIIASDDWLKRHNIAYTTEAIPLDGSTGTGAAAGKVTGAINLTLKDANGKPTTVTLGGTPTPGEHYIEVLVSQGTAHMYDLLLGLPYLRYLGGEVSAFRSTFTYRPRWQSHEDSDTTVTVQLRQHPRRAVYVTAAPSSRPIACCTITPAPPDVPEPPSQLSCPAAVSSKPLEKQENAQENTDTPPAATHPPSPGLPLLRCILYWVLSAAIAGALYNNYTYVLPIAFALLLPTLLLSAAAALLSIPGPTSWGGDTSRLQSIFGCKYKGMWWRFRRTCSNTASRTLTSLRRTRLPRPLGLLAVVWFTCLITTSAAVSTASLLGPDGCRATVYNLNAAGFVANHLLTPSSLVQATMPAGMQELLKAGEYTTDEEYGWTWGNHPEADPAEFAALQAVVSSNLSSFAFSMADLPGYSGDAGPVTIPLETGSPIVTPQRRYSPIETQVINEKCTDLYENNIIRPQPVTSYVCAPTVAAKKDGDGNWTDHRFCIDSRPVNAKTKRDRYRTKVPEELFQDIGNSKFFSCIDLRAGFHQLPIAEEDQEKTTFWWGNKTFCYNRLSFGLTNATAAFQRVMDYEISKASLSDSTCCFVDDVLIHSATMAEHVQHVDATLKMLHSCGLRAHPEKSVFGAASVEFLGHVVTPYGMGPHEAKVAAIKALPPPTNVSDLRSVLGFANYYRCYVPNFSSLAQPMNALLAKGIEWYWGTEQEKSFQDIKVELSTPGRALRRADPTLPYILYTDWSKQGIGAVLAQRHPDEQEYMVACLSRSLNKHEANYSSYEGEMLAAVWAVKTCRPYLHGVPFTIVTDHQPLQYLMTSQALTGKHARWALSLQDYEFTIHHRPGLKHANADVPSRFPRGSAFDGTGARLDGAPNDPAAAFFSGEPADLSYAARCLAGRRAECYTTFCPSSQPASKVAPCMDDFIAGNSHDCDTLMDLDVSYQAHHAQQLRTHARAAAHAAKQAPPAPVAATPSPTPSTSTASNSQLDLQAVSPDFYTAALTDGVVILELCGGMCAGLEAALRNGWKVKRYLYVDNAPAPRIAAEHRLVTLAAQYPSQLAPSLLNNMFELPQDVEKITEADLRAAGATEDTPWLVVAGWPCQDLSPAGTGLGLGGNRSGLFYDVLRTLTTLQRIQPVPPAYLLENAAVQHNFNHPHLARTAYAELTQHLGQPLCLDAAQFNSRAHRLRNYWTNLADTTLVHLAASACSRIPGLLVDDILDPNRSGRAAFRH